MSWLRVDKTIKTKITDDEWADLLSPWIGIYIRLSVNISRLMPDLTARTHRGLMRIVSSAIIANPINKFLSPPSRLIRLFELCCWIVFAFSDKTKIFLSQNQSFIISKNKKQFPCCHSRRLCCVCSFYCFVLIFHYVNNFRFPLYPLVARPKNNKQP